MIKAEDMGLQVVGALHEIARNAAVVGRPDIGGLFQGHAGGQSVRHRAHAADALGDLRGVARVAALEYGLEAAVHAAGQVGVHHLAAFHDHGGFEMALDTGDRIDGDGHLLGHNIPPLNQLS